MTIAAGLNFDDGLLISADSKHTSTYKIDASKIFVKNDYPNGLKSVFAFAGDMFSARMGIQHCEAALGRLQDNASQFEIGYTLEQQLADLYTLTIAACPNPDASGFDLIAGLWSESGGLHAYRCHDPQVMEFPGYALAGVGEYLGHYLIRPRYIGATMALSDAVALAISSLCSIKDYDDGCGGITDLVVIRKDGTISPVAKLDISQTENLTSRFWRAANRLLSIVAKSGIPRSDVDAALENFASDVEAALQHARATRNMQETIAKLGEGKALDIQRKVFTKQRRKRQSGEESSP